VSKTQAVQAVLDQAVTGTPGAYVCLTNVHTTLESRRSPEVRAAVDNAFLSLPDGMPLAWILRHRGHVQTEKVAGIEFIPLLARAGVKAGLRHFFYGGTPGVAHEAGRRLKKLVPEVYVAGALSPPFSEVGAWPLEDLQMELSRTRPHIVWVGLGAPKQEIWMARMSGVLEVPVMIGVGAALDFLAGTKRAAPRVMSRVGLEWLFRLLSEPRRLWRRYLFGNSMFLWLLARERFVGSSSRGKTTRTLPNGTTHSDLMP